VLTNLRCVDEVRNLERDGKLERAQPTSRRQDSAGQSSGPFTRPCDQVQERMDPGKVPGEEGEFPKEGKAQEGCCSVRFKPSYGSKDARRDQDPEEGLQRSRASAIGHRHLPSRPGDGCLGPTKQTLPLSPTSRG
jgi:hypothetical protein